LKHYTRPVSITDTLRFSDSETSQFPADCVAATDYSVHYMNIVTAKLDRSGTKLLRHTKA